MFGKKIDIKDTHIHGDFVSGDKIGLDEEKIREVFREELSYSKKNKYELPSFSKLTQVAEELLNSFAPPSLLPLFPYANKSVFNAISRLDWVNRRLSEYSSKGQSHRLLHFKDLVTIEEQRHLIIAPGGAGKTYSLWNFGVNLLKSGTTIPFFLSLSDFSSTTEIKDFIHQKVPDFDVLAIIKHPSLLFLLDGLSQFAQANDSEYRKLLALFGEARILSTGRYVTSYEDHFTVWKLELLQEDLVKSTLSIGLPELSIQQAQDILEFLRLPLVLILYMLLGGQSTTKGELIRTFQKYLTHHFPNSAELLKGMGMAAARVTLLHQGMRMIDFEEEISNCSSELQLKDAVSVIEQLGTLGNRYDVIQPIHDLYWEWLIGVGVLNDWDSLCFLSTQLISTRNGIKLALESGQKPTIKDIQSVLELDLSYAAMFLPFLVAKNREEIQILKHIVDQIIKLLDASRPVDRYRGIVAALASEKKELFLKVLTTISTMNEQGYSLHGLENYFHSKLLWENRDDISRWMNKSNDKYFLLKAIERSGDSRWVDWIREQFLAGKITKEETIRTSLGCTSTLPQWVEAVLPRLLEENKAYYLKSAAERGQNLSLALWVATNYEKYVNTTSSNWFHLNEILVKCGNDIIFKDLFNRFQTFNVKVQELLLFAFENRDLLWIKQLQEKYFESDQPIHLLLNQIFTYIFSEVSDKHARSWIQSENELIRNIGWKTLAKRHQNEILPELIEHLPESFNNVQTVPTLLAMRELVSPPETLIDELSKRATGTVQPSLMNDILRILANIYPLGVPSVAKVLKQNPQFLPVYHLTQFLHYLKQWEESTGLQIKVNSPSGEISFAEHLVLHQLRNLKSPDFINDLIKIAESETVIDKIVLLLQTHNTTVYEILKRMGEFKKYHCGLVTYLFELPNEQGLKDILSWFRFAFHTFPEYELCKLLQRILDSRENNYEYFNQLLLRISRQPMAHHKRFHEMILAEVMKLPETSLIQFQKMSLILNIYPPTTIQEMIGVYLKKMPAQAVWMVRIVESNSNRLLIDELGEWI